MSIKPIENLIEGVAGWLTVREAELLYTLANELANGTIIEIGSYHGRSTIALAYGASKSNSTVYAIDPHHRHEAGGYAFSPSDLSDFMRNINDTGLAPYIRVINLPSVRAFPALYRMDFDLVWIDGSHEYVDVWDDFRLYSSQLSDNGRIAIHDYSSWSGPSKVVDDAIESGQWSVDRRVDWTMVLKRT